jgi:hypothetical protein
MITAGTISIVSAGELGMMGQAGIGAYRRRLSAKSQPESTTVVAVWQRGNRRRAGAFPWTGVSLEIPRRPPAVAAWQVVAERGFPIPRQGLQGGVQSLGFLF